MNLLRAKQLLKEEKQKHIAELSDWTFGFDRSVKRFGRCNFGLKLITISKQLTKLNEEHHIVDTIRHEIAHALVGLGHGHDNVWKRKAIEIGCDGNRLYNANKVVGVENPYIGTCPNCKTTIKRFRRKRVACSKCCDKFNGGKFLEKYVFIWSKNK